MHNGPAKPPPPSSTNQRDGGFTLLFQPYKAVGNDFDAVFAKYMIASQRNETLKTLGGVIGGSDVGKFATFWRISTAKHDHDALGSWVKGEESVREKNKGGKVG